MVVKRPKEGFKKDQRMIKKRPDNSCRNDSLTELATVATMQTITHPLTVVVKPFMRLRLCI